MKKSAGFWTVFVFEVFTAVHTQNVFFDIKKALKSHKRMFEIWFWTMWQLILTTIPMCSFYAYVASLKVSLSLKRLDYFSCWSSGQLLEHIQSIKKECKNIIDKVPDQCNLREEQLLSLVQPWSTKQYIVYW